VQYRRKIFAPARPRIRPPSAPPAIQEEEERQPTDDEWDDEEGVTSTSAVRESIYFDVKSHFDDIEL
jgi:hypothetical protein